MSVTKINFTRPGFETEFHLIRVDGRICLFWHYQLMGKFLNFKQALRFAEHLGID